VRDLTCRLLVVVFCFSSIFSGCEKGATTPPPASETSGTAATESPAKPEEKEEKTAQPAAEKVADKTATEEAANPILGQKLLTAEEVADGWISLFDGKTLFGWRSSHDDINWSVADGAITADTGSNGALLTTVPFADYELVCEYRMASGGNSGIFLRSAANPTSPKVDFYEVNIVDTHPEGYLTGSLAMRQKADVDIAGGGEWQTLRMVAQGKTLKVFHNGKPVLEFTDDSDSPLLNGHIGLQKNSGKIEFRKVNLKPLAMESLFNSNDLSGWRPVPGAKSEFKVTDGAIHVLSGLGFLETEKTFQDFLFQAQVKTGAKDLNSGFFFRALPGTEKAPSHGYEMQVHNGFKEGDRNKPADAGTGAIFRRVNARRVVGNDLEWVNMTLVASGPRISIWVDGYQQVDWEDTREPNENPRQGRRVEGGHISLQGHDPTTDVLFRNMRIAEHP